MRTEWLVDLRLSALTPEDPDLSETAFISEWLSQYLARHGGVGLVARIEAEAEALCVPFYRVVEVATALGFTAPEGQEHYGRWRLPADHPLKPSCRSGITLGSGVEQSGSS